MMPSPARHDVRYDSRYYPRQVIRVARGTADSKGGTPELETATHNRGTPRDFRARLAELPSSHPSAIDYLRDQPSARRRGLFAQLDNPATDNEAGSRERASRDLSRATTPADYAWDGDIRITPGRRAHILEGDEKGGGGHRHGIGLPGKTEFPKEWDDHYIIDAVLAIARKPDRAPERQNWNGRWRVSGEHDRVAIVAIVESDGLVWTAWPREGSPGVVKNDVLRTPDEHI
jgi:hypothetical protein